MPDGTGSANPQAGNGAGQGNAGGSNPQAGNGDPAVNPQAGNSGSGSPPNSQPQMSHEDALEALRKERLANADARKKLAAFEKAQQEADLAKLGDLEKANKQLSDLQAKYADTQRIAQERIVAYEVKLAASDLQFHNPAAAVKLLDWSQLEFDDDGMPKNAAALLKNLAEHDPWLVKSVNAASAGATGQQQQPRASAGGATNPSRSGTNGGAKTPLSHEYIDSLIVGNPQEYVARGAEIRAWLLAHPRRGR